MKEEILIIDAENAVMGRLASYAAKQALLGKKIEIINSDKAIILGNKENILAKYAQRRARGHYGQRGPFFPTTPDRIMKRAIRNMLRYKEGRGRDAFKKIKCYNGIPEIFKDKKIIKSVRGKKGTSLKEVSILLRGGLQ